MSDISKERIQTISKELSDVRHHPLALALDFDGVCKLVTDFKHQIMFTELFLHVPEFQQVPYRALRDAYLYVFFHAPKTAGRERFLCVGALSEYLEQKGFDAAAPGLVHAIAELEAENKKINAQTLGPYAEDNDVKRILAWSNEVNRKVAELSRIGLAPGLREDIFTPFKTSADIYIVSTAVEGPIRESLEKESIDFIARYFGQETASKTEALSAMAHARYSSVVMFGDSVEDQKASKQAAASAPQGVHVLFVPVIPGEEEQSFRVGRKVIQAVLDEDLPSAERHCTELQEAFAGKEAQAGLF